MKLKEKIVYIFLLVISLALFIFIIIDQKKYSEIKKEELTVVTEIYSETQKTRKFYTIVCKSGNEYKLSLILGDDDHIEKLSNGDEIILGVNNKMVIELSCDGDKIITIDDCHKRYNKQVKISIIVLPLMILFIIIVYIVSTILIRKYDLSQKTKYSSMINKKIDKDVFQKIQESIYEENGILRCNILEQIESVDLIYTFYKAMVEYIENNKLVLLIEDGCKENGLAMVFYRNGEKLYFNQIFREKNVAFRIEKKLYWFFPFDCQVTKEEKNNFLKVVNEYIEKNSDLLKWER